MISVVVPIFNERENLPELRRRLTEALDGTGYDWEAVLVDDGSADGSGDVIRGFHEQDPRFKLVELSRNFGHQPAVTAGIHHARGDCVVLIDGDLQDPPEAIPRLVEQWEKGHPVVLGERRSRADGGTRGIGFRLFYPVFRRVSDLPSATDSGRQAGRQCGSNWEKSRLSRHAPFVNTWSRRQPSSSNPSRVTSRMDASLSGPIAAVTRWRRRVPNAKSRAVRTASMP